MELTDNQKKLIDILKNKGFDKDNVVAFLLSLKTENKEMEMLNWITKNKNATRDEVFGKWYELMNIAIPQ